MRSDSEIKRDVEDELRWEPNVDPTDIAVAVKNGVVTLTGVRSELCREICHGTRRKTRGGGRRSGQ